MLRRAPETKLDFVAHSAGALILNKALRDVPELPPTQVYHLVLDPIAEINDHDLGMFELVSRGTLLYRIDNFLRTGIPQTVHRRPRDESDPAPECYSGIAKDTRSRENLRLHWHGAPPPFHRGPATGVVRHVCEASFELPAPKSRRL